MKLKKIRICVGLALLFALILTGCGISNGNVESVDNETKVTPPVVIGAYEAEEAVLMGNVKAVERSAEGSSGSGYVEGFQEDDDRCVFTVTVSESGFYDLNFISASSGGKKINIVEVDGEQVGEVAVEQASFTDSVVKRIYMDAGNHEVALSKSWGWITLDRLEISQSEPLDESIYEIKAGLSNPKASENTLRLYSYLCDIYGKKFLSGQYCDTGQYGKEFQVVRQTTGKTPAVLGLDFIEDSPSRAENGSESHVTEYAISFWESGGIVTFCWHWNVPSVYLTGEWWNGFRSEGTDIDLTAIMDGKDPEGYELLLQDIDVIAEKLSILQEAGVPVLWRPLHEASGGWFWWGNFGPEAYIKLYQLMYDRMTHEHGLNNLIWLWNGQDAEWYPGDEYVDIIGEDVYPGEHVYSSQAPIYLNAATNYSGEHKMVYLSENGCLFDPDLARRDGAMWGMWCTWQREFVAKDTAFFQLNEQYTEKDMMLKVYADQDVITLEDLPDLETYAIQEGLR